MQPVWISIGDIVPGCRFIIVLVHELKAVDLMV
jgi:hypothetical protein